MEFSEGFEYMYVFQVRMAVIMKMIVFWDALMMEAVSTSEMSVSFYQTAWCSIPEDSHLECNMLCEFVILICQENCEEETTQPGCNQGIL
jgi:hypothetical protein